MCISVDSRYCIFCHGRRLLIRQKELEEKYPVAYVEKKQLEKVEEDKEESDKRRQAFLDATGQELKSRKEEEEVNEDNLNEVEKEEEEEEKREETEEEKRKSSYRSRISKCIFNPRECRFR